MVERITISVAKATTAAGDSIPDGVISISEQVPGFTDMVVAEDWFETQAQNIEGALYNFLPGGTYDRLTGLMLARKASHFRVAHR